jgi:hypothetical protein
MTFEVNNKEIDKIELLPSGDHVKGTFTFLFVIVLRYKDSTCAPVIVELQLRYSLARLIVPKIPWSYFGPLLGDMMTGLKKLMMSRGESQQ